MNTTAGRLSRRSTTNAQHATTTRPTWVRDDRYTSLIGLMIWALVVIMIVPSGLNYSTLLANNTGAYQTDFVTRLLWLALLGGGILVIVWRLPLAMLLTRSLNVYLVLFLVLATLSTLWSIAPGTTVMRVLRAVTFMVDAAAFVLIGWEPRRFQHVLRPIIGLMLVGSLIFGLVDPKLAIHQFPIDLAGDWHGLTDHKNSLGALAGIGLILWLHAWLVRDGSKLVITGGIVTAIACLLLSHSSTALMGTLFSALFMLMLLRSPRGMTPFIPYLVGIFIAVVLLYAMAILKVVPGLSMLLTPLVEITGKDLTFTGRTNIWAIVTTHIDLYPILGTGYGAYWTGAVPGTPSYAFVEQMNFYPGSAHNGYLDIINDLGFTGLLCLFGYLAVYVRQCLKLLAIQRGQMSLYLALFFQQALTNLSESHWLNVLSVNFVIMCLATFCIARSMTDLYLRQRYGSPATMNPAPDTGRPIGNDDHAGV